MKPNPFDPVEFKPYGDCCIAAAVLGAGALGAGASIYGANKAASAQTSAANAALGTEQAMFAEEEKRLDPFIKAGQSALPALQGWVDPTSSTSPLASLVKLTSPGADMTSTLEQLPGFKFQQNYGQMAVKNALAARGLAGPGGALGTALSDYATQTSLGSWQSLVNSLLGTYTAGAGGLQNLVNTGSGAAGNLAGNATTIGGQLGSNLVGIGNAQAGGAIGTANAISGLGQSGMNAYLLDKLLGGQSGGTASGIYGLLNGTYGNLADAGFGTGVGTGGFNAIDAMA